VAAVTTSIAGPEHAQIFVETLVPPLGVAARVPIVFVHGGHHTGTCWTSTPDGRPGWAPYAAQRGHTAYVIDWPAHGRSPARELANLSLGDVAEGVAALLERVGPAVLITHSMGGVVGWRAAELARDRVAGIVAIAPGPPANLQPALAASDILLLQAGDPGYAKSGRPMVALSDVMSVPADLARSVWANTKRFPMEAFDAYVDALAPESGRALNERNNIDGTGVHIAGPQALAGIPKVVMTGDADTRHPRDVDAEVAAYFGCEFVWLADRGLTDRGHMLMIEHGSDEVAAVVFDWIAANVI
jgi:pimeloyl-ACP methyl ester carboxylesterase